MRHARVRLAVLLTVALLANSLVVVAAAPPAAGGGFWERLSRTVVNLVGAQQAAAAQAPAAQGRVEVPQLRTRNSRTYRTPEGLLEAVVSAGPVNYQDANGSWQPIDNTLVATRVSGYAWQNKADRYRVLLPANLADAPIRIERGGAWISFKMVGASAQGQVRGNTVTYPEVFPGVTISFAAAADTVKESIVLANAGVPASYRFQVNTSPGLSFRSNDGGLDVYQGSVFQFALPAPFMFDASNSMEGFSKAVSFQSTPTASGLDLEVVADAAWLASPKRQWPVTIDPTTATILSWQVTDCHIVGGSFANQNFCSSTELEVGSASSGHRRGLVYYPVEGLVPPDSQVLDAKVRLWVPRAATNGPLTVGLYQLTNPFTTAATWTRRNATTNWTTAGGDYSTTKLDTEFVGAAAGLVEFSAPDLVQRWVNGQTRNDGFLLRRVTEDANTFLVRFNSSNTTGTEGPQLSVLYEPRLGDRDTFTYDTKSLSDRSELKVNVANGNLLVGVTDFYIRGTGMDLVVNRTYNELARIESSPVGDSWHLSVGLDVNLRQESSGVVILEGLNNQILPFWPKQSDPNSYTAPPGTNAVLTRSVSGSTTNFTLTWKKTGEVWRFSDPDGFGASLNQQEDRNGNRLDYSYDASGRLSQVKQLRRGATQGRTITASYIGTDWYIDKLTDSAGRVVDYGYTGDNLTSVTDADGKTTRYDYTAYDFYGDTLTRITDPRNNLINITYEPPDQNIGTRRVTSVTRVTAAAGDVDPKTSYSYTAFSSQTCTSGGPTGLFATTSVTDANNKTTIYKYDSRDRVCRTADPLGHAHNSAHDPNDNVTSTTDALAKTTSFGRTTNADGISNLTSITRPGSNAITLAYGDTNNPFSPSSQTDSAGDQTTYSYDAAGNLATAQQGAGGPTSSVTRNLDGTVATAKDGNNRTTTYTYTYTAGVLTKLVVTPPSGSTLGATTTNFDNLQRPASVVDGKGQTHSFTYDAIDRIKTETVGSLTVSHTYDANGNHTHLVDPTGTTTFTYDELNRGRTKTVPGRPTMTYTYDGVGNLTSLTDAGGTVSYRYDAANRLDQLTEPGNKITTFTSDNADRRKTATFPNGVIVTLGYDDAGRQVSVKAQKGTSPAVVDLKYCYKKPASITDTTACGAPAASGNTDTRYKVTDSRLGQTTNYGYDNRGQLTQAKTTVGGTNDFQYAYDPAGNRTKQQINGGTPTFFGYGSSNELCWSKATATDPGSACAAPSGATTYTHNANGSMTGSSAGFAATYNGFEQATSITGAGGSTLGSMTYGGSTQTERRRAGATDFTTNALGLGVAAGSSGVSYYTRDNNGALISQRTPSGSYYFVLDALGSVVALTDSTGAAVGRYAYEPYGKATFSGTQTSDFQYASGYSDSQTKLVKFGARYYDPSLGRWTQQDPLAGSLGTPKSLNRYAYAENDPANKIDRTGTQTPFLCFLQFQLCVEDAAAFLITCSGNTILLPTWLCQSIYRGFLIGCKLQLDLCLASCS